MPKFGFAVLGRLIFALVFTLVAAPILVTGALAQQQQQQQNVVQQFLQNPQQVLQQYPNGGTAMISFIRQLAIDDPKTLEPILALLPNANKDHKAAIGTGLGQAAKIIVKTNQAYANQILQAIAETKDQDVFLAYSGVSPDQGTASTGGGGGAGGGGGVGGQTSALGGTPTSTGGAEAIGGGSDPTSAFSYTSSTTGVSIPTTTTVSR